MRPRHPRGRCVAPVATVRSGRKCVPPADVSRSCDQCEKPVHLTTPDLPAAFSLTPFGCSTIYTPGSQTRRSIDTRCCKPPMRQVCKGDVRAIPDHLPGDLWQFKLMRSAARFGDSLFSMATSAAPCSRVAFKRSKRSTVTLTEWPFECIIQVRALTALHINGSRSLRGECMDWATRCGEYITKTTGILGGEHCVSFLGVVCRTNGSLLPDTASHSSHRFFIFSYPSGCANPVCMIAMS